MILIWSRWGIAVVALALLGIGAGYLLQLVFQAAGLVANPGAASGVFTGIGLAIGGGFIWLFDRYVRVPHLDKPRIYLQTSKLVQPQTLADGTVQTHVQSRVQVTPRSSFFFVPFKYWWIIVTAIGGVVFAFSLFLLLV